MPADKLLAMARNWHKALKFGRVNPADNFCQAPGKNPYRNCDSKKTQAKNSFRWPKMTTGGLIHGKKHGTCHYNIGQNAYDTNIKGLFVAVQFNIPYFLGCCGTAIAVPQFSYCLCTG